MSENNNPEDVSPSDVDSNWLFYSLVGVLGAIILFFGTLVILDSNQPTRAVRTDDFKKDEKDNSRELIGMIGKADPENLPKILKQADSDNPKQRMYALRALKYYGVAQADRIVGFLDDSKKEIRTSAMQILGNMGYIPAATPLAEALRNEDDIAAKVIGIQALSKICRGKYYLKQVRPALDYLTQAVGSSKKLIHLKAQKALIEITGHDPHHLRDEGPKQLQPYWKDWLDRNISAKRRG